MNVVNELFSKKLQFQITKEGVESTLVAIHSKLQNAEPYVLDMMYLSKLTNYITDTSSSTSNCKVNTIIRYKYYTF